MKNYLDKWVEEKLNIEEGSLSREAIEDYQLRMINETIIHGRENSEFYKEHLKAIDSKGIKNLEEMKNIPLLRNEDCSEKLICVSMAKISRVVTLDTSGTTGKPKRVYFSQEDQELTIDFFHRGMMNLINEEDTLLILMPTRMPGSIGDLLRIGVERMGAKVVAKGPLEKGEEYKDILGLIRREGITSIVATSSQMEGILAAGKTEIESAEESVEKTGEINEGNETVKLNSILLSAEYVPDRLLRECEKTFNCKGFEHFGMTETGLGGAVSCYILEGYHPREADLYFEIIDPKTGLVVEDGQWGELVVTTLTRKAMPFIRYRTGDEARWLTEKCKCGSQLKRLDKVRDRKNKKGDNFYV